MTINDRLIINTDGNMIAGRNDFTYNDTNASNNTFLELYGGTTAGNRGILSLSGRTGSNDGDLGTIWFVNANNAGTSPGTNMKLAAAIQAKSVTNNSNSQGDSGSYLQFMTKQQGGSLQERVRLWYDGTLAIGDNRSVKKAGELQVVNTGSAGQDNDCLVYFETNAIDWVIKTNVTHAGTHYHTLYMEDGATRGTIVGADGSNVAFTPGSDYRYLSLIHISEPTRLLSIGYSGVWM